MSTTIKFNVTVADEEKAEKFINALKDIGIEIEEDGGELVSLDDAIAGAFPDKTHEEIIGMLMQDARKETGITQEELAKKLGTSRPAISAMESGKRPISKDMAKKLAKIFEMDYRTFL